MEKLRLTSADAIIYIRTFPIYTMKEKNDWKKQNM